MKRASTAVPITPTSNPIRSVVPRIFALLAALLGLSATLTAAPVTVPDHSFEDVAFPGATNAVAPGGTELVFNGGLTPAYDWWGAGFADTDTYPTVYVQNADTNSGLFPLTADGMLQAPADGTNYVVVGGSGDMNVWQPLGPLQSNTVYTLTVALGIDLDNGFLPSDGSSGYGGGTGLIALVGGTGIYDIFTPGDILASLPVENTNYALGSWVDNTLTFTNGYQTSGTLTVLLRGLSGFALDFDNIRLDASPATPGAVVPTITTADGSNGTTNYQGTPVTLLENPVGNPPFNYAWQTDSGTHGATWTAIPSATGLSYTADTSTIAAGSSAEYRVVVNSGAGNSTSPSITLSSISGAPVLVRDTLPSSGSFDVVGSQVTFSAVFDGSRPITYQWQLNGASLAGATNEMLTLSLTDTNLSGSYSLLASNALGTNSSTAETFTVNPLPDATNGVVVTTAMQWGSFFGALGYNEAFTPSFALATNSIIAGLQPSSSIGIFTEDGGGGLPILTDGTIGAISPADNGSSGLATAGDGTTTNGIGYSITYTLPTTGSGAGWTITNITSFGGWADSGREEQTYQISYSTPLAPTNFSLLPWTAFNPPDPDATVNGGGVATATKMSISSTNGILANNVGAITINFYSLAAGQTPKNGWEGYAEFQLFGAPSTNFPPAPVIGITPASGSDVEGSSVTILATFASVDPISYQWYKDGGLMQGQTRSTLILTNLALTDTAVSPGYVLQASNALGISVSAPSAFTVNPALGADGSGVIFSEADQAIPGGLLTPTWTFATNSLLAGLEPFATAGNFYDQNSANGQAEGGPPTLTDGQYGVVGNGNTLTGASAGPGAGTALYYNLPASSNGWDITGIASFGGWSDIGRNNQGYDIYFATTASPAAYTFFDELPTYSPPVTVAEPNATRVIWTPGNGVPFAQNVVGIEFVFTETVFNAWEGYNELQVFGTNSTAAAVPAQNAPIVATDIAPGYGSDVVGSSVTFTAGIFGADSYQWQFTPVNGTAGNLAGATNETYTINDLNTNETGGYTLIASNAFGLTSTSTAEFTVNPAPAAVSNIVTSEAVQIDGNGTLGLDPSQFLPTWTIPSGSLIAGMQPSTTGPGNFLLQLPGGGIPALTDGTIGELVSGGAVPNYASAGDVASGAGQYVIYTLPPSTGGYNISSIITYGGWPDYGRDDQYYTVMYSTVENPTHFVVLGQTTNHVPQLNTVASPNTSRITWTSVGGGTLASNVAAIEFNFTTPAGQENDWQGYSELQVFGTPSQGGGGGGSKSPTISSTAISSGNLTLGGSGGTPGAGYAWLSSTNLAIPLSQWTTNSTGTFDSGGNFSTSIPISHSEPGVYFVLKPE